VKVALRLLADADQGTRIRDARELWRAANRGLGSSEHAPDHPREVQEHEACEQHRESTDATPPLLSSAHSVHSWSTAA
jgi:hypothetical protein